MENRSENHLRAFKAIASVIEKRLLEIQVSLAIPTIQKNIGGLEHINDLQKDEEDEMRKLIEKFYTLIDQFFEKYDLKKDTVSIKHEILIKATFLWEELSGSTAKRLLGYGAIEENIATEFEGQMNEMTELINDIIKICS